MKISKDARKLARKTFDWTMVNGRLDLSRVRQAADMICLRRPRHVTDVLKEFTRLVRLKVEERHAVIESATPLDPSTGQSLAQSIRGRFGDDLTSEIKVSPELIGGLRVKIGSDVWDGSVRNRLARLKEQL